MRRGCTLFLALIALAPITGALAHGECWSAPTPATVEEALKVAANPTVEERSRLSVRTSNDRHVLLMSGGTLKAAYAAGLLVGWSETGRRPRFVAITAVELSALIAPLIFIGPAGDQAIADIFNCSSPDAYAMAARAASYLDDNVLEVIAREHEAGRRLIVALPGSAARPETVWDIGHLAAGRHPGAADFLGRLLRAAVDRHSFVDPAHAPIRAGRVVERTFDFRSPGAGAPFLFPSEVEKSSVPGTRYHLIHNDVIFPDESGDFIQGRKNADKVHQSAYEVVPAYDVVRHAMATTGGFQFASIKLRLGLIPQGPFDMIYLRALFMHAYRQGRMGKEWKSAFPGLLSAASDPLR